jgi:hypothetical protein
MTRILNGLVFCLMVGSVLPAHAGVLYSTGFENPPFTPGDVAGQDGWSVFNDTGTSQVETGFVDSGSQALAVIPALAGVNQSGPYYALSTPDPVIDISADVYIFGSSNQSGWQFAGTGPSLTGYAGGFDLSSNGTIDLITPGSTSVGTWTYNNWNLVDLLLNFNTQTFNLSVNGTLLAGNVPFCGSNSGCTGANVASFGDFFFDTFPSIAVTGANNANDLGVIDNLTISSPVPEPRLVMLLAAGLVALVALRARRGPLEQADR